MVDYATVDITTLIMTVRGKRVILDADLARIYGVPTRRLNEQVRRNTSRFPPDFAFAHTERQVAHLKSQIATSSYEANRSQFVTGSQPTGISNRVYRAGCGHAFERIKCI